MTHARCFTLSVFGLEACFQPAQRIAVGKGTHGPPQMTLQASKAQIKAR